MPKEKRVNKIKGGVGDDLTEEDVSAKELEWGIEIEKEHSPNIDTRKDISFDHLEEDKKYYTHLREMEKKYSPKKKAFNLKSFKKHAEKVNPFAICHTTVDKEKDPEKYEKCVMDVKKKNKEAFNLKNRKI